MRGHIESSENPEVKCPYMDDDYHCDEVMQEREIREVYMCSFYTKTRNQALLSQVKSFNPIPHNNSRSKSNSCVFLFCKLVVNSCDHGC